ncbi:MAG TPA: DUF5615 family PIN-like protein [Isosphaeraceae bacterium]|nr:DUF5615 family PIN-like protein [Isosphaeraceae bacterium]
MILVHFFTDEDIHGQVAVQLRAAGFDAISTPEAGRLGQSDLDQLTWATAEGRAVVTFNVADFARLHHEWMIQGRHHCGVIVSQQRPLGDLFKRLLHLGKILGADDMKDRLEYLSNWSPI